MDLIYREQYKITAIHADCFERVKPSVLLYFAQEVAGEHSDRLGTDWETLQKKQLFWALIRTRVEIQRLPRVGETITVETWPLPETRTAYPRCTVGYDERGEVCFRCMSLWVLVDTNTRTMVLPGKCDVRVDGIVTGQEPEAPRSLPAKYAQTSITRTVGFEELDRNFHMNNTRYMAWVMDLLDSSFHGEHFVKEFTICYLTEAREGQSIELDYHLDENRLLTVNGRREKTDVPGSKERIFAASVQFS